MRSHRLRGSYGNCVLCMRNPGGSAVAAAEKPTAAPLFLLRLVASVEAARGCDSFGDEGHRCGQPSCRRIYRQHAQHCPNKNCCLLQLLLGVASAHGLAWLGTWALAAIEGTIDASTSLQRACPGDMSLACANAGDASSCAGSMPPGDLPNRVWDAQPQAHHCSSPARSVSSGWSRSCVREGLQ